jgi:DNA-binding transcriptional MerR regulator
MKIGEIAQQMHVSKSIIRYYEDKGVLPRAVRDAAGYRDYGQAEHDRIQFVTVLRRLGCSFDDIRELLVTREGKNRPSDGLLEVLSTRIIAVEQEIDRLRKVQCELLELQDAAERLAEGASRSDD